jgi:hypothetical protein
MGSRTATIITTTLFLDFMRNEKATIAIAVVNINPRGRIRKK